MLELLINFGTGILGLLTYSVYNSRSYIMDNTFSFKKGMKENWKRMLWVVTMILLLVIIYKILPEAFSKMTGLDGFEIPGTVEKGTFFGIAILLSKNVKLLVKKSI